MSKRWMWNCEDVQEDIRTLQNRYKNEMGYDLSLEEVYDIWSLYSERYSANWMTVNEDILDSESIIIDFLKNR